MKLGRAAFVSVAVNTAGIFLALAPFLMPRIPVVADGVKHLVVAHILNHYHDPALRYEQSFGLTTGSVTAALPEFCLAGLERIFPPFDALKAYLACFVILLWAAGLRLMKHLGAPASAAVIPLPIALSFSAFGGLLPFIIGIALFPFFLAALMDSRRTPLRIAGFAAWLLLLFAFHIVAGAVGCLALGVFALRHEGGRWRIAWGDLVAAAPIVALGLYFTLVRRSGSGGGRMHYYPLLNHLKSYWAYNIWTLSRLSGILFLLTIVALAAVIVVQLRTRRALWQPALLAGLLVAIGSAMPYQIGEWFIVGSRTLPFALIAGVACLNLRPRGWYVASAVSLALLLVSSVTNTQASMAVQPKYDEFLSGMRVIPYGSRVLPIVADLTLGGNPYVMPFVGIDDAYPLFRGGSSPYVSAHSLPDPSADPDSVGGTNTGAAVLQFKYSALYAYKFSPVSLHGFEGADYRGAGRIYDYFVVYGRLPYVMKAMESEGRLIFSSGELHIYKSLR